MFLMRTTLALNDDVFNIANQKAQRDRTTVEAAVSALMRVRICSMHMPAAQRPATCSKYAVLPTRNETVTSQHVYKLMEQKGVRCGFCWM